MKTRHVVTNLFVTFHHVTNKFVTTWLFSEEEKMRFKTMATITAVIFIAAGAAFDFKGWDLVTAYGGPEVPIRDSFRALCCITFAPRRSKPSG